jgi:glycerate-2-kinase
MQENLVKNFNELATNSNRKLAFQIMESGLNAINTESVIFNSVKLENNILSVGGENFDLSKFKNIKVVGFGKSSCDAALALEKILGSKISRGAVVGLSKLNSEYIEIFAGTHPRPSEVNVEAGEKIYEIIKNSTEEDLIIVLVSGGGSSLLCYGKDECRDGVKLYDAFLGSGKTITEINTVRKHLSLLKGGGLAKIAYPATIIGLIFSDVPGDNFENVASGPTYKDKTTVEDAKKIIQENNLGDFDLMETSKEDKYFDKVHNFVLVSNKIAVEAMAKKAQELNLSVNTISTDLYDEMDVMINKIFSAKREGFVVLAAGEPRILVKKGEGKGGRNLYMGLSAIKNKFMDKKDFQNSVFISFASDGMDNSDVAGAVVDSSTIKKAEELNLDVDLYLNSFDSYTFFEKTGDMIMTGPTGANVSDLMILLTKK